MTKVKSKEMSKEEIENGNRLIAEFMSDGKLYPHPNFSNEFGYRMSIGWYNKNALSFDSDWSWLMPVVEKIEVTPAWGKEDLGEVMGYERIEDVEYKFSVEIKNGGCVVHRNVLPQYHGTEDDFLGLYDCRNTNKIESTWKAVVAFLTWYNSQNKG